MTPVQGRSYGRNSEPSISNVKCSTTRHSKEDSKGNVSFGNRAEDACTEKQTQCSKQKWMDQGLWVEENSHEGVAEEAIHGPCISLWSSNLKKILICGSGLLADGYDTFVLHIVLSLIKQDWAGPSNTETTLVHGMLLIGEAIGALSCGILADYLGRRSMAVIVVLVLTTGALLSSFSESLGSLSIYETLAIWQAVLGMGIGGQYPIAAVIASETVQPRVKGCTIASVLSMQGVGSILAGVVPLLCLLLDANFEFTWRFSLAFIAIPGLICLCLSRNLHETPEYLASRAVTENKTSSYDQVLRLALTDPDILQGMAGTAIPWFLLSIAFYGNVLFLPHTGSELNMDTRSGTRAVTDEAYTTIFLAAIGYPGYLLSIWLIDAVGRKQLQIVGFLVLAILFSCIGGLYDKLTKDKVSFFAVYGLMFFFANFGPNTTTFVIPAEAFSAEIRATCHGLAAAVGKLGGVLITFVFSEFEGTTGFQYLFWLSAVVSIIGFFITIALAPGYSANEMTELQRRFSVFKGIEPKEKKKMTRASDRIDMGIIFEDVVLD
mmetsp:Transcript_1211/g.2337  ORF Transcript_1211/g.2337 Transcript_1211/m.2337 type:complete len:549 (-) Transcript_1211:92-1738(-)|eukprot:CAMPEP_0170171956 /NCGR_PEP_ID=MMETSP0040_2-20121228/5164_1 /TAXON_ID=641309 /ORGANISM="Lotharella oceanica, Strain CCMP622" /LENGTH=548 /DNA_ID=CAMNT_0010412325 /DNA_START=156 /DNA_END=1802 /DNA_ORIENTATION=+